MTCTGGRQPASTDQQRRLNPPTHASCKLPSTKTRARKLREECLQSAVQSLRRPQRRREEQTGALSAQGGNANPLIHWYPLLRLKQQVQDEKQKKSHQRDYPVGGFGRFQEGMDDELAGVRDER